MYLYVYADFVQDRKFEKEMLQIENRLTDLGIVGKITRLGLFKRADELIRDEVRRGVTTVVVVGNDDTIRQVLDVAANERVAFGLIPLGPNNHTAKLLGIPEGLAACDVLSARIVEAIDVGVVNGKRFICGLTMPSSDAEITCEGNYRVTPQGKGTIEVRNLALGNVHNASEVADPRDGRLQTVIRMAHKRRWFSKKQFGCTTLPLRNLAIRSERPLSVQADGMELTGTRFDISVEPLALCVITGKGRMF